MPVDCYFSDHDITGPEMADLVAGNPVAGITSSRAGKWWEVGLRFAKLGRSPIQARLDARAAKQATRTASSWNGTRVAVVIR